jgi:hypothetical protein
MLSNARSERTNKVQVELRAENRTRCGVNAAIVAGKCSRVAPQRSAWPDFNCNQIPSS